MNDNTKYLSLGNLFNIIKEYANNKMSAMQSEIFCSLFNIKNINNTTVNNYCIGYRAIGLEYKKIYIDLRKKYKKDYNVFINIILSKKVGDTEKDFSLMWEYLNKAIELGSVAAINTMGNCYMNGINKKGIIDEDKAMEYYLKASEYGYVYFYNIIGLKLK